MGHSVGSVGGCGGLIEMGSLNCQMKCGEFFFVEREDFDRGCDKVVSVGPSDRHPQCVFLFVPKWTFRLWDVEKKRQEKER